MIQKLLYRVKMNLSADRGEYSKGRWLQLVAKKQCPVIELKGTFQELHRNTAAFALKQLQMRAHTHTEWWFGDSVGVHTPLLPKITTR